MDIDKFSLFRPQVFEHLTSRVYGEILVKPKVSHMVYSVILFVWLLFGLYFVYSFEWLVFDEVGGTVGRDDKNLAAVGVVQLPPQSHLFLDQGQVFPIVLETEHGQQNIDVFVKSISNEVESENNIATSGSRSSSRLLKVKAVQPDRQLVSGARFKIMLPIERQRFVQWLGLAGSQNGELHE